MNHAFTLRVWNPFARRGTELEADLSALQRDAQEQARPLFERDDRAAYDLAWIDPVWGLGLALPQLQLVGARR